MMARRPWGGLVYMPLHSSSSPYVFPLLCHCRVSLSSKKAATASNKGEFFVKSCLSERELAAGLWALIAIGKAAIGCTCAPLTPPSLQQCLQPLSSKPLAIIPLSFPRAGTLLPRMPARARARTESLWSRVRLAGSSLARAPRAGLRGQL